SDHVAPWQAVGCGAWFSPGEVDPDGVPCLVAHTEVPGLLVHVEAGLTVLSQLLDGKKPLFREGAHAHVVFVSDTHDPGAGWTEKPSEKEKTRLRREAQHSLVTSRPTGAELAAKAAQR